MAFRIPLPAGGRREHLDIIDPFSSMVQRFLRREGLANYEPETAATLLTIFELQRGELVLFDVGANIGLYSHLAASVCEAKVHAFEPTPATARIARAIAARNSLDVNVHEVAISDERSTATLHLSATSDASNSLAEGFKRAIGAVDVQTDRLDDVVARLGVAPTVLKIDVETHEAAVLAGAGETLATARPFVVIEVLRRRGMDQGAEIQRHFDGLGYHFHRLSKSPDWDEIGNIRGSGTVERDWLLTPEPLPEGFADRWDHWYAALAECTTERNSGMPLWPAIRHVRSIGGWTQVVSSGRHHGVQRTRMIARSVAERRIIRVLLSAARRRQYRVGRSCGVVDRALARLVAFETMSASERLATVDELIDEFFTATNDRQISVFVEAGAKDGAASRRARSDSGIEHVIAFEANPHTHKRFHKRLSEAGVDHRFAALVDEPGKRSLFVRRNETGQPQADGQASLLTRPDHEPGFDEVEVPGVRLDDELVGLPGRVAIWIDVEGATSTVLRGGPGTLDRTDVALVEVETRQLWDEQEWLHVDVVRHLLGHGLRPVARDAQSRHQFNVLFVRDD